jgi:protein-L-isoaspartate(D-aspartate) O-methyltransferase
MARPASAALTFGRRLDDAFLYVPRREFLRPHEQNLADEDRALPIGHGQTNTQPSTLKAMLQWLAPEPGDTVLDVGSGSGWSAALLAYMVGKTGHVYAVELVTSLVRFGQENAERLGIENASFVKAGNAYGLPEFAPYERILASASAQHEPHDLLAQLAAPGRAVIPVRGSIHVITRDEQGEDHTEHHSGFAFVPLL